ncbi:MAG TPA: PRC-barrel domain-containing protein [Candidatus Nanoarchaeia archaeon]|nr:PRC-barrel domain-containing protein [Candidatus Nanoarchaeia archaeon]
MVKTLKITDLIGMPVYTDDGNYYGDIEESVLLNNKVFGWRVRSTKHSQLSKVLSGARGVTVPHQMVKAIGNIILISKSAMPAIEEMPDSF